MIGSEGVRKKEADDRRPPSRTHGSHGSRQGRGDDHVELEICLTHEQGERGKRQGRGNSFQPAKFLLESWKGRNFRSFGGNTPWLKITWWIVGVSCFRGRVRHIRSSMNL